MSQLQTFLIPSVIVGYLAYKVIKFKKIRKMIPKYLEAGAVVVDVRSPAEFNAAANPGSLNIPLNQIQARSVELDQAKTILVCCASGTRSGMAAGILKQLGFKNVVNVGPWTNTLV
jgi:rhodanese-related sulfurtransferase